MNPGAVVGSETAFGIPRVSGDEPHPVTYKQKALWVFPA